MNLLSSIDNTLNEIKKLKQSFISKKQLVEQALYNLGITSHRLMVQDIEKFSQRINNKNIVNVRKHYLRYITHILTRIRTIDRQILNLIKLGGQYKQPTKSLQNSTRQQKIHRSKVKNIANFNKQMQQRLIKQQKKMNAFYENRKEIISKQLQQNEHLRQKTKQKLDRINRFIKPVKVYNFIKKKNNQKFNLESAESVQSPNLNKCKSFKQIKQTHHNIKLKPHHSKKLNVNSKCPQCKKLFQNSYDYFKLRTDVINARNTYSHDRWKFNIAKVQQQDDARMQNLINSIVKSHKNQKDKNKKTKTYNKRQMTQTNLSYRCDQTQKNYQSIRKETLSASQVRRKTIVIQRCIKTRQKSDLYKQLQHKHLQQQKQKQHKKTQQIIQKQKKDNFKIQQLYQKKQYYKNQFIKLHQKQIDLRRQLFTR